jgi:YHS domain-containing protein
VSALLRYLLITLGLWALSRLLFARREAPPARRPRQPRRPAPPRRGENVGLRGRMVRDPVCGTHIAPEGALSLTDGEGTHYFCGASCRDRHLAAAGEREPVA